MPDYLLLVSVPVPRFRMFVRHDYSTHFNMIFCFIYNFCIPRQAFLRFDFIQGAYRRQMKHVLFGYLPLRT